MTDRARLEAMLAAGEDNALLRFALGSLCMKAGEFGNAAAHFRRATEIDPGYSAAWKNWGRCLIAGGDRDEARRVFLRTLAVTRARGDKQIERETMGFLRRLGAVVEK